MLKFKRFYKLRAILIHPKNVAKLVTSYKLSHENLQNQAVEKRKKLSAVSKLLFF